MADSDKTYDAPPNTRGLTDATSLTGAGAVEHRAADEEQIDVLSLPVDPEGNPPGTPPSLRPGGAPLTEVASELPTRRGPFGDRHE